jgi:hypothetical protein
MDEIAQIPSRLGQVSAALAVLNLVVLGALIFIRLNVPSGWMNNENLDELQRTANWVLVGNLSIIIFPILAITGLVIGAVGYFQPNYAKFYSYSGMIFNGFLLIGWVIGMIGYQIIFHSDSFYVK